MALMMVVVIAVMLASGNGPMGMMMGHEKPAQTSVSSPVEEYSESSEHAPPVTKD